MKAVFLDRDGTIIREVRKDLTKTSQLQLYHNVPVALKILQQNGYKLIIITNQSLIARGLIQEAELNYIHKYLKKLLAKKRIKIDGIYYCPHHPEGIIERYRKICNCRKPQAGLLRKAMRDFNIEPSQSFFIGDSLRDMEAAGKVGIKFVLVLTGYGKKTLKEISKSSSVPITANPKGPRLDSLKWKPAANLLKASQWIITEEMKEER
jgi:D-glycero-D-manno-heptose 1,7-bisphosphate phosphatase